MSTIYIYPTYNPIKDKSGNLYIKYFAEAFVSAKYNVSNNRSSIGILSLFFNLRSDIFIINWIDLIRFKKFGLFQSIIFVFGLLLLKILNKKVIWILHNKYSHKGKSIVVDYLMAIMARFSTKIITHSNDGVEFYNIKYGSRFGYKAHYIPHPVYNETIYNGLDSNSQWDCIIWGSIDNRKRLDKFVRFVKKSDYMLSLKILICGNCNDKEYLQHLTNSLPNNISIIDGFIEEDKLHSLLMTSKIILFTYSSDTLLSSGALIYSLNYNKILIGPNSGNFRDLNRFVNCYNYFEDIPGLVDKRYNEEELRCFLNSNKWIDFPNKLCKLIFS